MSECYCFFSAQYLPSYGGVERYTHCLAQKLCERGESTVVVCSRQTGQPEEERDGYVIVLRVPALMLVHGRFPVSFPGVQWRKLCERLDSLGVSKVVVQTQLYTLSLMGLAYAETRALPRIVISHGSDYIGSQNPLIRSGEYVYERLLAALAKKRCGYYYAVSAASCDFLSKFGIKARGVLYNAIDDNEFLKLCENNNDGIKSKFDISEDIPLICFVGRLIPEKGVLRLERAAYRLYKEFGSRLVIAGDGPLLDELSTRAGRHCLVLGRQSRESVAQLLDSCDIFCLPSDSEGFPTTLLEAALAKCYCIAGVNGGAKELIYSEELGCILSKCDEDDIYFALKKAICDSAGCRAAANKLCAVVSDRFTWDKTCDKLCSGFDEQVLTI